jgi:hypothetical protein
MSSPANKIGSIYSKQVFSAEKRNTNAKNFAVEVIDQKTKLH